MSHPSVPLRRPTARAKREEARPPYLAYLPRSLLTITHSTASKAEAEQGARLASLT
jgi:hypothetical protein